MQDWWTLRIGSVFSPFFFFFFFFFSRPVSPFGYCLLLITLYICSPPKWLWRPNALSRSKAKRLWHPRWRRARLLFKSSKINSRLPLMYLKYVHTYLAMLLRMYNVWCMSSYAVGVEAWRAELCCEIDQISPRGKKKKESLIRHRFVYFHVYVRAYTHSSHY